MTLARNLAVFVSLAALVASSAAAIAPETPSLKPGKNLVPVAQSPVVSVNVAAPAG